MARSIQVLLYLVYLVLAEARRHMPFFDQIPGLPHPPQPFADDPRDGPNQRNVGYNGGYDTWFQHFANPDDYSFNSDSHKRDKSYEDYDPFHHGDPYFQGNRWNHMPGIRNVFTPPNPDYNNHRHQPLQRGKNPQERPKQDYKDISYDKKPKEKHIEIPPIDKKPTEHKLNEDNPYVKDKLNEAMIADVNNNSDLLPPKTNKIKNEDEKVDKVNEQVGLNKNKDFLLVGQGNNGNNVYLLHEINRNPNTVVMPNGNQPGNNIMYVPYNPGQTNNPVYQVINGQPSSLPANVQMTEKKIGVSNGYDNAAQSTTNLNTGIQNPGYVTILSNGQFIQIPGVVVNSAPNNVPLQNANPIQGTNYIIANTVPNNVQTVPACQNPGTNVIYATIPNQASNGPIYVQVPNCGSGTDQGVNNGISNYNQPTATSQKQQDNAPTAAVMYNQYTPQQTAGQMPMNNGINGNNKPMELNQAPGPNATNQGGIVSNQNIPLQSAVKISIPNEYNVNPPVTNPSPPVTVENRREMSSNQNVQPQPSVTLNSGSNGYQQPQVPNQGDQGTNAIVNTPNNGEVINQDSDTAQPQATSSLVLDNDYLSSLGAQPAIMISDFKEKSGEKKI